MATTATQQPQMGLSFEQVWAGLMELRARQEKPMNRYGKPKQL